MLMRSPKHTTSLNQSSFSPVSSNLLERKCSCGKCSKCDRHNSASQHSKFSQVPPVMHEVLTSPITEIQPKLKIGAPNDKYEREADRVAEQVMRMPEPKMRSQIDIKDRQDNLLQTKPLIQRRITDTNSVSEAPSIVDEVLRSPGQPLDSDTRSFMESRFGRDFDRVRVHTNEKASAAAKAIDATAFTVGQDVVFEAKEYMPDTAKGKQLLAHELVHTIQQGVTNPLFNVESRSSSPPNIVQRRIRPENVSCNQNGLINPNLTGIQAVTAIEAADSEAIELALRAELLLDFELTLVRAGETPNAQFNTILQDELGLNLANTADFTIIQQQIDRIRRVRQLLESGFLGYTCRSADCEGDNFAFSFPGNRVIRLCQGFWDIPEERGATVLHEPFHILFDMLDENRLKRARATCFEAFAFRVAGLEPPGGSCAT